MRPLTSLSIPLREINRIVKLPTDRLEKALEAAETLKVIGGEWPLIDDLIEVIENELDNREDEDDHSPFSIVATGIYDARDNSLTIPSYGE